MIRDNDTIIKKGFNIRKPFTLILKNVDDRYDRRYKFEVEVGLKKNESIVTVTVASKCHFTSKF